MSFYFTLVPLFLAIIFWPVITLFFLIRKKNQDPKKRNLIIIVLLLAQVAWAVLCYFGFVALALGAFFSTP